MSRTAAVLLTILLVPLALACQFDGYVPKGKHQPVAEEERSIEDLSFDTPATGTLDCAEGRCRVRHRLHVDTAGHIEIQVDGPRAAAESSAPRLARVMLQDVNGRVVARNDVEQMTGPMAFEADVSQGPHFVLIQGLGPEFEYQVLAHLVSSSGAPAAGATAVAGATSGAAPAAQQRPPRTGAPGDHSPGDTSDGADFAYDPSFDLITMRTYAFAENPQATLEGEAAEDRGNPFVIRRIQREIRYALADFGVAQADAAEANFLVSVQVGSKATTWYSMGSTPRTTSYDAYFDRWRGMGAFINPHTYVDGTLVIDFIDPKSGDLVWHGWTTEPVNVKLDDENLLKGAVRAVLAQFAEG